MSVPQLQLLQPLLFKLVTPKPFSIAALGQATPTPVTSGLLSILHWIDATCAVKGANWSLTNS